MTEYTNTAIGWVNQRTSNDGNTKYLTVKFSNAAEGLVLREGVTFAAFRQKSKRDDMPDFYMIVCENDQYEELRLADAGGGRPPAKTKQEDDGFDFDDDEDDLF